jgi:hypothetical protein
MFLTGIFTGETKTFFAYQFERRDIAIGQTHRCAWLPHYSSRQSLNVIALYSKILIFQIPQREAGTSHLDYPLSSLGLRGTRSSHLGSLKWTPNASVFTVIVV